MKQNSAEIINSLVTEGCEIYGKVENSVLFSGVVVEEGAYIKDSVVMSNIVIKKGASVNYSIIDSDVKIGESSSIGKDKAVAKGITVIGAGLDIADNTIIEDDVMVNDAYYEENLKGGAR